MNTNKALETIRSWLLLAVIVALGLIFLILVVMAAINIGHYLLVFMQG